MLSFQLIPVAFAQAANQGQQAVEVAHSAGSDFATLLGKGLLGITIFAVAMLFAVVVRNKVKNYIEAKAGEQHKNLVILYSRMAFIVVAIAGGLVGMLAAGIPIELFTGGLGLGIGFAIKGPIENFFAGTVLLTQDKFNVGDTVEIQGRSGKIVDVSSRATTIRGWDGEEITIPNSTFINEVVVCRSRGEKRRHKIRFDVAYGTDIELASEIILDVIRRHPDVEPAPEPSVLTKEIGAFSIFLSAKFWTASKDVAWWKVKSDITRKIFEELTRAGVSIPYPVQTLNVDAFSSGLLASDSSLIDRVAAIEALKPKKLFDMTPRTETNPAPAFSALPAEPVAIPAAPAPAAAPATPTEPAAEPKPIFAENPVATAPSQPAV